MLQETQGTIEQTVKRIYICYVQLNDMLAELTKRLEVGVKQTRGVWWEASASYAKSFNAILAIAKEAFKIDDQFAESIQDLENVEEGLGESVMERVISHGSKLRGTLQAFVSLHMSAQEKEKIGFHS